MLGKLRSLVEEEKEVELYICCYSMSVDRYNTLYNITPTHATASTNTHGNNNNKNSNKRGRNGNSNTHTNTNTTHNNKSSKQQHNEQRVVKQFALFDCLSIDDMIR